MYRTSRLYWQLSRRNPVAGVTRLANYLTRNGSMAVENVVISLEAQAAHDPCRIMRTLSEITRQGKFVCDLGGHNKEDIWALTTFWQERGVKMFLLSADQVMPTPKRQIVRYPLEKTICVWHTNEFLDPDEILRVHTAGYEGIVLAPNQHLIKEARKRIGWSTIFQLVTYWRPAQLALEPTPPKWMRELMDNEVLSAVIIQAELPTEGRGFTQKLERIAHALGA